MARKRKETWFERWGWLMFSSAGIIMFGFGILQTSEYYHWNPLWVTSIGAIITAIAIYLKKFRTETSVALKKR